MTMPSKKDVQKALEMVMFSALQKDQPLFVVDDELFNAGRAHGLIKQSKEGGEEFRQMPVCKRSKWAKTETDAA